MIPISELRSHLEILDDFDDLKLRSLREDAIAYVENDTQRILSKRRLVHYEHSFACGVSGLRAPLISIDSIQYRDGSDVMQTMPSSDYVVTGAIFERFGSINSGTDYYFYPQIELEHGASWPSTSSKKNSVVVTYTAGFEPHELPGPLKRGILIAAATFYENRETLSPVQMHEIPAYEMAVSRYRKCGYD